MTETTPDVVVVGGGQAGLASAYYLRRAGVDFLVLDAEEGPGGAWRHGWDSLRLFSPAGYSSLPGWLMPPSKEPGGYPTRNEVLDYLVRYEERYHLAVKRPVRVDAVESQPDCLTVHGNHGTLRTRAVISATGTWGAPHIPVYPGQNGFRGEQLHSAHYVAPDAFAGQTVLVIGGGNSAAQILAEVSKVARTIWVTLQEPAFLPDDVDGRVLFERATARIRGNEQAALPGGFGDIVMVASVREARERGVLASVRPFRLFGERGVTWEDGSQTPVDAVIWCTGFRPALGYLHSLGVVEADGRIATTDNQSIKEPRLWLLGYGDWTGAGSATLVGAGRTARDMVPRLLRFLAGSVAA